MRDEENAAPALAPVAHHGEHPLRKIGRQCRRDLVEDQELRVLSEGSGEIEHPERRQRKVVDELSEIQLQPHRREVRADRVDRRTCQAQVPGDREIGHERRVLEHRREPEPRRLSRRARTNRLSRDGDGARVGPNHPGERLDEGALPRAVGAEQRVHLPRRNDEVGGAKRDDRPVLLRDPTGFEERCLVAAHVGRKAAEGADSRPLRESYRGATAPCTPRTA